MSTNTILSVASPADLVEAIGQSVTGEWFAIDQDRIQAFADATEDWQWIHLDAERAASGPFGAPVAHGYLTLALIPRLTAGLVEVAGAALVVNYGLDKVRFLQPVTAGSRVRATSSIVSAVPSPQGVRAGITVTVEIEGAARPALVADTIVLFVPVPTAG